jgi:integral membrane sensor domain MASE1/anti-sigma regulatory factor (Ser/Thr protein kinase)
VLRLNIWRAALALAYFGAAKLGLGLAEATPTVTAIWPPTGLALVALVLGGRRLWPGIAVGAFAANVTTDIPVYSALGIGLGNTLEAVVGATLLASVGFRPTLRRLRDIFALVALAAIISTTISATIGVASVSLGDSLPGGTWSAWRVWWLGDMGGDLLVAPFLFVAITHWPYREAPGRALEAVALIGGLVVVGLIVFAQSTPVGYVTFPFYIWAALRFLQPGATTVALVTAALAVAYTAGGESGFVLDSEDDSLLLAQTFSAVVGLSGLILATVMGQRREGEREVREIAHALQAELLPPQLPEIPQMETAAWYRAGMRAQEVGGDFYDVFEAAPGQWVAVIGDVCGKGPEAASLTALARYTLRAVDGERSEPSDALRMLNAAILAQRDDQRFMTVALAHVNADGGEHGVTVSNGGHPLPLIVRADGEVSEVGAPGTLLGIYPNPRLANYRVEMRPGDALVLFTDGLSERRDAAVEQTKRIRETLRSTAGADAARIAESLKRIMPTRDEVTDDVAVLVLRRPTEAPVVAVDLDPVAESAARARAAIAPLERALTPDVFANLRLLVTELVTNSVRHARLSGDESIHLLVAASARVLRVEVSDPGVGFEQGTPRPALDGSGGFGLYIADRLADRWGVDSEDGRTRVWLEKELDPHAP